MKTKEPRLPSEKEQKLVNTVSVRAMRPDERERFMRLLNRHHYLGDIKPVGEQILYVAVSRSGGWRALLVFCAAANHLQHRDKWIGWTNEQRRRRLALVANNARYLILPGYNVPNMGTRVLKLALERLSADWQERYSHPLAVVESFVNPEVFQGTVYKAGGWVELGMTQGCGRVGLDYYTRHNKPKRLFAKELCRNARRGLQAEHMKPAWAPVEKKVSPRCTQKAKEIRSMMEHFKNIPDYRSRIQAYPVWSLTTIVALAYLCGAPRGPKDLAKFARQMSRGQRRAVGIPRNRKRYIPAPSQSTFQRVLKAVNACEVETAILAFQAQVRGPAPKGELVAIDGKAAKGSQGEMLLNAVAVPSLYYLGSEPVPVDKTNEIPVARALFERLDLVDRLVGLDALHTLRETACKIVQEAGADFMLTVKGNQKGIKRTIQKRFAATPVAAFPPSPHDADICLDRRGQSHATGKTPNSYSNGNG